VVVDGTLIINGTDTFNLSAVYLVSVTQAQPKPCVACTREGVCMGLLLF
jgi:L-asparaginase/Glu-tRNA(Gln) amidotransferase subunit D